MRPPAQPWAAWRRVAGVDEAGRGPLAGPVVAAAVVLDARRRIDGLADSKLLAPATRAALAVRIRARAAAWAVAWADCEEIDALNILEATLLAMRRALLALPLKPAHVQVDGNRVPAVVDLRLGCTVEAIIAGDRQVAAISAASILAKTFRDEMMRRLDACYPGFDLATHKGYATAAHLATLRRLAPSPIHRRSFAPVKCRGTVPG
ncbi:MAG TPA: ribonuclease HII [Steroidobacteraceae bacterium]|nr:ribonuclease HII [Steroidobacteraceae bacterium]